MIGVYLAIISLDYRIPYINPPEELTVLPLRLGVSYDQERYVEDALIGVFLRCEGVLTARKQVVVSGLATVSTDINNEPVLEIQVAFETSHAFPPQNDSDGFPLDTLLHLYRVNGTNRFAGKPVSIYWPVPGDFAPFVISNTASFSAESTFALTPVHIEPESVNDSERFSRMDRALTLAITYFAFIEGFSMYFDYRDESFKRKSQQQPQEKQHTDQA